MECSRCGDCCKGLSEIVIYEKDIKRWKRQNRTDILKHFLLEKTETPDEFLAGFADEDGNEVYHCPFLKYDRKRNIAECLIYGTRPTTCRENPQIDVPVCNKAVYRGSSTVLESLTK
ncbi:MAG: YkgJ family cysteine cluster protein [DPANN group archaeon]|nr:YkgJ family cysteine cluster protein [DPANN group archaeon]